MIRYDNMHTVMYHYLGIMQIEQNNFHRKIALCNEICVIKLNVICYIYNGNRIIHHTPFNFESESETGYYHGRFWVRVRVKVSFWIRTSVWVMVEVKMGRKSLVK